MMETELIDTHSHLYYKAGTPELSAQIERCKAQGIGKILMPNVDLNSISQMKESQKKYPAHCFPMMGLHPCSVDAGYRAVLELMEKELSTHTYYGIGEIGLDLHWDQTFFAEQQAALETQLSWARELDLPVSIHCRKAYEPLFEILEKLQDGRIKGVLHCFSSTFEDANKAIELGLHLGIGGIVTYKNAGLDKVVAQLDPRHLVLETDSPYLAPTPFRGKENESSYLRVVAEKVAELQGISLQELAKVTTKNATSIFPLAS